MELDSRGGTPRKPAGVDARATFPLANAKNSLKMHPFEIVRQVSG
jgi:hypothetical protein